MVRRRLALLAFAAMLLAASAVPASPPAPLQNPDAGIGPASLIVASWVRDRFVAFLECGEGVICTQFTVDARIRRVRTLSGPPIPSSLTVRAVTGLHPRRGAEMVMLIQPGRPPEVWRGLVIWQERSGEACVDGGQLSGFGVAPPSGSRRVGDLICTPI